MWTQNVKDVDTHFKRSGRTIYRMWRYNPKYVDVQLKGCGHTSKISGRTIQGGGGHFISGWRRTF